MNVKSLIVAFDLRFLYRMLCYLPLAGVVYSLLFSTVAKTIYGYPNLTSTQYNMLEHYRIMGDLSIIQMILLMVILLSIPVWVFILLCIAVNKNWRHYFIRKYNSIYVISLSFFCAMLVTNTMFNWLVVF